jgi:death-on-curing protein
MILRYGGFFAEGDNNLANPGALDYVLTAIRGSFFGHVPYPSLLEKAAALAWHIITRHVFHDGNKRTGMESCRLMLDLNGYTMTIDRELIDVAIGICEGEISFDGFISWLENRVEGS